MSSEMSSPDKSTVIRLKEAAAAAAADCLESGMIVGLGSGSTASLAVTAIGKRVKEGLRIIGIPTSELTASQATSLGIPLATFADYSKLDVAIDGADEVELGTLDLIKGGGGNQLREKIVAAASSRFIIIVDETKLVPRLGTRAKVPVEVAQFGWQSTARELTQLNLNPGLRLDSKQQPFITDGGNYILDCATGPIASARELQAKLDRLTGVMEHGLFLEMTSEVIIGGSNGIQILKPTA